MPDMMIWQTDPEGWCTTVSASYAAFIGQAAESQHGFGWLETVHPHDREQVLKDFQDARQARCRFVLAFRVRNAEGTWVWIQSGGRPRWEGGEYVGYIGGVYPLRQERRSQAGTVVACRPQRCAAPDQSPVPAEVRIRRMTDSL